MVKALLLTDSDVFAGTERHILELAGGLQEGNVEVLAACPANSVLAGRCEAAGIGIYPVEKRSAFDVRAVFALVRGLREGRFNLIHTHNGRTSLLAALAVSLAGRGHLVTTEHFLSPAHSTLHGVRALLSRLVHRWIARRAGKVIAISEAVRHSILRRGAAEPGKVAVVLNGIKAPSATDIGPRESVRLSLGLAGDTPLVITVARLEKEKGLDVLIRAMPAVSQQLPGVRCIVAGGGAERSNLEQLIKQQGVVEVVHLLGFRTDVLSLVAAADVFVLPSLEEPFGLALLEAMALGVPVIASRAGGPLEMIEEGQTGLLVTPGDSGAFASAILRLLEEPDWSRAMGARSRQRFLEHFTARQMASNMRGVYESLFATPAGG